MQFLPNCGRIDTAIWLHYIDANKTAGEKARRQLLKNAAAILNKYWMQPPTKYQQHGPSRKLSNLDEPDMQDTAGEAGTRS